MRGKCSKIGADGKPSVLGVYIYIYIYYIYIYYIYLYMYLWCPHGPWGGGCILIYIYICTYIHTHTHTHTYIYIYVYMLVSRLFFVSWEFCSCIFPLLFGAGATVYPFETEEELLLSFRQFLQDPSMRLEGGQLVVWIR